MTLQGQTERAAGAEDGMVAAVNLFATNTPRRESNLLIFIVRINCTDRRMHVRLFFPKSNIMQIRVSFQFVIGLAAYISV